MDYIVQNTVGKLVDGRTPKEAAKLRILDPACGSGSFLLGAYDFLLKWYLDAYVKDGPEKHKQRLYQSPTGWKLAISEKKQILLNNIYGVDIDPQAVEVTKLSLLLKVLEGESEQTAKPRLIKEPALPDLDRNIKCGNSLIGPDFYQSKAAAKVDEATKGRINAFDWKMEFPEIMRAGGFDAVIGNPPYIRVRVFREFHPEQVDYLEDRYRCAKHVWDIYLLFFEQALTLSRPRGRFSFIVPIQTLHQPNCESLRKILVDESSIVALVDLSRIRVFEGPIVKNCILVCEKAKADDSEIYTLSPNSPAALFAKPVHHWPQKLVPANPGYSLKLDLLSAKRKLCEKLRSKSWRLDELCYVTFGLRSCAPGRGRGGKDRLITSDSHRRHAKPYLEGRDIERYSMFPTGRFIRYIPKEMYSPRRPELFEANKLVSQTMLSKMRLVATMDELNHYVEQSLLCIVPHGTVTDVRPGIPKLPLEFMLGALNSRLESFYFATYVIDFSLGGGLIHATPGSQGKLLIPRVSEKEARPIAALVRQMLSLNRQSPSSDHEKTIVQRQIDATDRQIDQLVYQLYGLTEDEIALVESSNQPPGPKSST